MTVLYFALLTLQLAWEGEGVKEEGMEVGKDEGKEEEDKKGSVDKDFFPASYCFL